MDRPIIEAALAAFAYCSKGTGVKARLQNAERNVIGVLELWASKASAAEFEASTVKHLLSFVRHLAHYTESLDEETLAQTGAFIRGGPSDDDLFHGWISDARQADGAAARVREAYAELYSVAAGYGTSANPRRLSSSAARTPPSFGRAHRPAGDFFRRPGRKKEAAAHPSPAPQFAVERTEPHK